MGYYGLTYSATNLVGNFYINYGLSMQVPKLDTLIFVCNITFFSVIVSRLVEVPAYLFGMLAVDKIGRRPVLTGGLLISGLGCLIAGLAPVGKLQFLHHSFHI